MSKFKNLESPKSKKHKDKNLSDPNTNQPPSWGSDVVALALREQGFPYVCLNPGASYRGLHDSLVNYLGNERPEIILCLHEEHAVAIAHGYAAVTDTPLAAIVHSNVGLMHASMAIFNAWCSRVPMVILGATGPVDAVKRRPWIDWIHTAADQGALVRNFTKWDDQPASPEASVEAIRRGSLLTRTRPSGPVYINLDVSLQEAELQSVSDPLDIKRYSSPEETQPQASTIAAAWDLINQASKPIILSGRVNRSVDGWQNRIQFAEMVDAPVLTSAKDAASFPSSHPLFAGETGWRLRGKIRDLVDASDLIISLDWVDLAGTLGQLPKASIEAKKIIHISIDSQLHRGWSMDYQGLPPVDLPLASTPETGIATLIRDRNAPEVSNGSEKSVPQIETKELAAGELGIADLAREFALVSREFQTSLISRPIGWPPNANVMEHPLDFIGSNGGGGVGAGPGMAIGAALALRDMNSDRIPVAVLGDGDFMMGVNALWTAANKRIPLLIVVANNRSFFNDEAHQQHVAEDRDRPVENAWIGQRIEDPDPNLVAIAEAQGWEGEGPVSDPKELKSALQRGFSAVKGGKCWVVDVHIRPEYDRTPMVEYI